MGAKGLINIQEIHTSDNVDLTPNTTIVYRGTLMSSYEQILPPIKDMVQGGRIYVYIDGDINSTVTFKTLDGSTIHNGESTYQAKAGDKLLFIVGLQKYTVFDFTLPSAVDHNDPIIQELKNDVLTNATEITTIKPLIDANKSDVEQMMTDMVDVQGITQGNTNQITIYTTEIAQMNSQINALENSQSDINQVLVNHTVQMDKNTTDISTNSGTIVGQSESIDGLQDHVSQMLNQLGGISDRYYISGFWIPHDTQDIIFAPNGITNEAFLNPVEGKYNFIQGREYYVDAKFSDNNTLPADVGFTLSFELIDADGEGVYDVNNELVRFVKTIPAGGFVGDFQIKTNFVMPKTTTASFNIHLSESTYYDMFCESDDTRLFIYENWGLVRLVKEMMADKDL